VDLSSNGRKTLAYLNTVIVVSKMVRVSKVGPSISSDVDIVVRRMPSRTSIIPPAMWHVKDGHKQLAAVEKEQLLMMEYLLTAAGPSF
jgi:hypothetical protein